MKSLLVSYSRLDKKPSAYLVFVVRILELATFKKIKKVELLRRLLESNRLPILSDLELEAALPGIEILFVCAGKDFEMLPVAIEAARRSVMRHELLKISVVVPENDVERAVDVTLNVSDKVSVISETTLLPFPLENIIRNAFKERSGWIIQQILKIIYVSNSSAAGVLVCDADTILCKDRVWFDSAGNQVLTPSWEKNPSYYRFLNRWGLCDLNPALTFVSHHMLMQPQLMLQARVFMNWDKIENLTRDLVIYSDPQVHSSISIDYEFYAQFLMSHKPERVRLIKWSNLSLARKDKLAIENYRNVFASISLHDYLT